MAHSTFRLNDFVLMREDVISFILNKLDEFVDIKNRGYDYAWIIDALSVWREDFEVMPPGAKCVELETWIIDEDRRATFIEAIRWIEGHLKDWIEEKNLVALRAGGSLNLNQLIDLVNSAKLEGQ